MMTFGSFLLVGIGGYIAGVLIGMVGVPMLSSNRRDLSLEAIMTSIFVIGPAFAVLSMIVFAGIRLTRST